MFKTGEGAPLEQDNSRQMQDVRMPMYYPPKEQFAKGGDVYGDNSKIKVVGNYEGEHRLVPISPKNTNYRHVMEYVPIDWLMERRGNEYRHSPERMEQLRNEIQEEGLREPVLISTGKNSRTSIVGEGNHRVLAAHQLGYTHIPVRAMVGSSAGNDRVPEGAHDEDIIPEPNKYFPSDAKPSRVMRSLGYEGQPELPEDWWEKGYAAGGATDDGRDLNDFGLYSHAAEQAGGLQKTDTPENYKNMLMKLGVKPAEIEYSGYDKAFADQPQVTREQVAEHFQNNMPKLLETQYGDDPDPSSRWEMLDRHGREYSDYANEQREDGNYNYFEDPEYEEMIQRHRAEKGKAGSSPYEGDPFHRSYTIPGGENYREILTKHDSDYYNFDGIGNHFGGDPNIVASLRLKDREDAEGSKILHLEELQSDWGQRARQHGFYDVYRASDALSKYKDAKDEVNRAAESEDHDRIVRAYKAQKEAKDAYQSARNGVERAPYIDKTDNWVDLGLKRALLEAAEKGHDKLAWSPGDVQADRYSLSKHIKEIHHQSNGDGTYNILAQGRNGSTMHDESDIPEDKLAGILGKEMAEKIIARHGDNSELDLPKSPGGDWRKLSGLSLDVGGEGMKTFYDQMLPKRLLKLARMHDPDAEFSKTVISHPRTSDYMSKVTELPSLNMTPRMRESILKNGFSAFAQGGEVDGYADRDRKKITR
jgi:hypothetical protein